MPARIIGHTDADLALAADSLLAGNLVAFPTETVYGLGANALNDAACRKIYAVKGRPATDPLICHVHSLEQVRPMWAEDTDDATVQLALFLGRAFWPGPLTLVVKAASIVPDVVTGGSGFVGVRIPRHDVTLQLLQKVNVPVAGPSANTFGHVSPTMADHVMTDLALRDPTLLVMDGGSCAVGIESTVVKIVTSTHVEVLRRGQVSVTDIQRALNTATATAGGTTTEGCSGGELSPYSSSALLFRNVAVTIRDTRSKFKVVQEAMDGPGQLLTHYTPCVPAFLVSPSSFPTAGAAGADQMASIVTPDGARIPLSEVIVMDFRDAILSRLQQQTSSAQPADAPAAAAGPSNLLAYTSLSTAGSAIEASREVFNALRWTETVDGAKAVVFPLLSEFVGSSGTTSGGDTSSSSSCGEDEELLFAVEDRLFRAASGVVVSFSSA